MHVDNAVKNLQLYLFYEKNRTGMDSKTFKIIIFISSLIAVEAFPQKNDHLDERLEPRGLGDYMPAWFWSSKNAEEDNTKLPIDIDRQDEKSNIIKNHNDGKLSDDESPSENGSDVEKINPVQEIPQGVRPENVDKIIQELKEDVQNADAEEKTKTLNLWKSLTKTVSETTSPYVEVVYKNARHVIDIGAFGTSKRSRCFGEMMNPLGGIIGMILSLLGLMGGGLYGKNANLGQFIGSPTALSASNSNANAGALSLAGLGGTNPGGVQWVSLQDLARMGGTKPNLGGGNQLIDFSRLGLDSQVQPNQPNSTMDPNNMLLMALLLRLLGNGNGNGSTTKGIDTTGIDLSKLPSGVDKTGLLTLIRQLSNQPETNKGGTNDNSRVVIVRTSDLEDPDKTPFEIFNIRGTPEERFRKIRKKYKNNPDVREKIIILDELNRLKNDSIDDPGLLRLIDDLEIDIKDNDDYEKIFRILKLNPDGTNNTRKFKNVRFIDGSGKEIANRSFNGDDDDKLWKELLGSLSSKYSSKNIDDPNTLRAFFKDLNLRSFD